MGKKTKGFQSGKKGLSFAHSQALTVVLLSISANRFCWSLDSNIEYLICLVAVGLEHVTEVGGKKIFRKRK
jgi:hypothetical protein